MSELTLGLNPVSLYNTCYNLDRIVMYHTIIDSWLLYTYIKNFLYYTLNLAGISLERVFVS